MPGFGIRERFDKPLYDTHFLEPGKEHHFYAQDVSLRDQARTNMQVAGCLPGDKTFTIGAIGLRVLGKTQEENDLLLDHLRVTVVLGDKPYGPYSGTLCSTFRMVVEDEDESASESPEGLFEKWWYYKGELLTPGYALQTPLIIPSRQSFCLRVQASAGLPEPVNVRSFLFGLETRDLQ